MRRLRVLLCEPYFAGSHRSWAEGFAEHSAHDVALVTHAGGFWKWRMQGAALTIAAEIDSLVRSWGRPDVLLTSDMVHLPALLGLARTPLDGVPVVLYMHENQLTYPLPEGAAPDYTYAITNWLSMAAADRVVFNSEYHRTEVFAPRPKLLKRFPDYRHLDQIERVRDASCVLPVGVELDRFAPNGRQREGPPVLLWNHRWEYDKDPEACFAALAEVAARDIPFRVIVAGETFRTVPEVFTQGCRELGERVIHFGMASEEEYPRLVAQADIAVSTSKHEFFGVSVVEAIAGGALPLLPDRLSYPELVPTPEPFLYETREDLVEKLSWALLRSEERALAAKRARAYIERFSWPVVACCYDELLVGLNQSEDGRGCSSQTS